jgi:predicted ATPase
MRVAISGTHCCGKSTLIDEFLSAHPDFVHEPEPYTVLQEEYGEVFSAEPSADEFYRQLEFNLERLRLNHPEDDRIIYERSPADFLAYILALSDLGREQDSSRILERSLALVTEGIRLLDLIAFIPADDEDGMATFDSEDPELRAAVNRQLAGILIEDGFDLLISSRPTVLEVWGSTAQRLRMLERALDL